MFSAADHTQVDNGACSLRVVVIRVEKVENIKCICSCNMASAINRKYSISHIYFSTHFTGFSDGFISSMWAQGKKKTTQCWKFNSDARIKHFFFFCIKIFVDNKYDSLSFYLLLFNRFHPLYFCRFCFLSGFHQHFCLTIVQCSFGW